MVKWLRHPRHTVALKLISERFTSPEYRFRRLAPVVFLCGAARSERRDWLRDFPPKRHPDVLLFYAEAVWDLIAAREKISALEMEAELAGLAGLVAIVVESPGTYTELGAFANSEALRKKLLPILDVKHRGSESFIVTGPIRWIDRQSAFKPPIWVDLDTILECVRELDERVARIPKGKGSKVTDVKGSPKHFLFFLCDLVALVQPASVELMDVLVRAILGDLNEGQIEYLLSLASTMGLVTRGTVPGDETVYFFGGSDLLERPFHRRPRVNVPSERARYVSVLQLIPEARAVLQAKLV